MRRIGTLENEAGLFDLAGSSDPASLRPAACEPVLFGDLVAVIVSDAGAIAAERRLQRAGSRREFHRISRA
jgi:hypothetical protein